MRLVTIALTLILLVAVRAGEAAPIFYSTLSVSVTYHGLPTENDADSQLLYNTDTLGPLAASVRGGWASASVADAALRAFATTDGQGTSASGYAGFFDTLLLQSSTLAPGTAVQLQADLVFTRVVTPNGIPVTEPCLGAAVALAGMDGGSSRGSAGSVFVQDTTCDIQDINNPTALFTGFIGEELTINAFLNAGVGGLTAATADALNTLRFFLTPVGDFTYTTASGNSYVAPQQTVAEPATLMLLGSGLSLVAVRARRRYLHR